MANMILNVGKKYNKKRRNNIKKLDQRMIKKKKTSKAYKNLCM
jgi:hypothetical protein